MQTAREIVVISRYWHSPAITVGIDQEKIRIELSLDDFCRALVQEIPHPAMCFSRQGLETNILAAMRTVLEKTKEASVYNPPALAPQPGPDNG